MNSSVDWTVVTGAKSGLGLATVNRFARTGPVYGLDVVPSEAPQEDSHKSPVCYGQLDIRDDQDVQSVLSSIAEERSIRTLVHCAGVLGYSKDKLGHLISPRDGTLVDNFEMIEEVIRVNLVGTLSVVRHAAAEMVHNRPDSDGGRGVIILTSSGAGLESGAGRSAYAASKAAVAGITLGLAREMSPFGIRVVAIAPGYFETPMLADTPKVDRHVPFPNRKGKPQEFADSAYYCATSPYINGTVLRLDGGTRTEFAHHAPFVG